MPYPQRDEKLGQEQMLSSRRMFISKILQRNKTDNNYVCEIE